MSFSSIFKGAFPLNSQILVGFDENLNVFTKNKNTSNVEPRLLEKFNFKLFLSIL